MSEVVEWSKMHNVQRDAFIAQLLGEPCDEELGIRYLDEPEGDGCKERFGWTPEYTMQKIAAYQHQGIRVEPTTQKRAREDYSTEVWAASILARRFGIVLVSTETGWKAAYADTAMWQGNAQYVGVTHPSLWQEAEEIPEAICKALVAMKGYTLA